MMILQKKDLSYSSYFRLLSLMNKCHNYTAFMIITATPDK